MYFAQGTPTRSRVCVGSLLALYVRSTNFSLPARRGLPSIPGPNLYPLNIHYNQREREHERERERERERESAEGQYFFLLGFN